MRCGTPETSWHVTAKSSIHGWGVLYKSGVYASKVVRLTPGGLYGVPPRGGLGAERSKPIAVQKSAEGIVGGGHEPGPVRRRSPEASPR
jgi:hypothetical protein